MDEDGVVKKPLSRSSKQLAIEWLNDQGSEHDSEHEQFEQGSVYEEGSGDEDGSGDEEGSGDADDEQGSGDDEEVLVDEEHIIEEVEVPMDGFTYTVDAEADSVNDVVNNEVNIKEYYIEVLDFDEYESDLGDETDARKLALRELKKQGKKVINVLLT